MQMGVPAPDAVRCGAEHWIPRSVFGRDRSCERSGILIANV